jgi:hypothetical protein
MTLIQYWRLDVTKKVVNRSNILVFAARICCGCDIHVICSHSHSILTSECKHIFSYEISNYCGVKTDILYAFEPNKFYRTRQYMIYVSVI